MKQLIITKPGVVTPNNRRKLKAHNIDVAEVDTPEDLIFTCPDDCAEVLKIALSVINDEAICSASTIRERFCRRVSSYYLKKSGLN